ncbi:MAG TPA: isoamylase early set domain-containing protein [Thermodesulfovibrionales bacterium]|nr:isoamylase early set domain-containing protein [Thermodesulfovibrionales bacterium]
MAKLELKGAVRGKVRKKTSEPLVPLEETAPKGLKRLAKARTSNLVASVEMMGRNEKCYGLREERCSKETVNLGMPQEISAGRACGIKKHYLTSNVSCWLTFRLPKEAVGLAKKVAIVGDFNKWDKEASPMKKLRSGDFEITLELSTGREYRFRYLMDGHRWENDWCADRYERNPYGGDDSVVIV